MLVQIGVKVLAQVAAAATVTSSRLSTIRVIILHSPDTGNVAIHSEGQAVSYGSTAVYCTDKIGSHQQSLAIATSTVGGATVTSTQAWNQL